MRAGEIEHPGFAWQVENFRIRDDGIEQPSPGRARWSVETEGRAYYHATSADQSPHLRKNCDSISDLKELLPNCHIALSWFEMEYHLVFLYFSAWISLSDCRSFQNLRNFCKFRLRARPGCCMQLATVSNMIRES